MNTCKVTISEQAKKDLKKVSQYIAIKLYQWVESVSHDGLLEVRKISGYHDEPLQGKRKGQRSIRLNKAYRANGQMELVEVMEVNKHDY
ncbi:type II toxin-antitoxin system mRNA interferase toxin, RelE/StbE family [Legionella lytica]|mgnify:CR=1 FL=1|uniref:Type II toxin-antitoxin system mRNA interferase toxin, RelE/StbE family n=1 Tax=Legionella lytica TaxID=96232 RepID=A0ABW8DEW7_9GAMM